MFKLRPYQLKAVEFCTQKLAERKNSLLVAATGAGKTIMLSAVAQWICRQGTGKVYVVVGRDKINQQNIEKFRKVVPEYPASEFSGRMKSTHGRVIFLTVQTAIGHYMKLPRPMAVIFDECFVKGTKIATPFGEKNIEKIKVGDKVFCFNEKNKKIEIKKVEKTYKNPAKSIMRLNFGTQMIQCTPNHPFYTKRGWVQAKDLKENDYILQLVPKGNHKFNKTTKGLCSRKRLFQRYRCKDCGRAALAKKSSETMAKTNRKHASARMRAHNPMKRPEVRKKVSDSLKRIGHRPKIQGGNGKGLTIPQKKLLQELGNGWLPEYPIAILKWKTLNTPKCYKTDIANPNLKIAIEIDGQSHLTLVRKEQDQKKTRVLNGLGWIVLRFWNREIMENLSTTLQSINTTIISQTES